jgi:hypothetical protein
MNPLQDYSQGKKIFSHFAFTALFFFICTLPIYALLLLLQHYVRSGFLHSLASFIMFVTFVVTVAYAKGCAERGEDENLGIFEALKQTHHWHMLLLSSLPLVGRFFAPKEPEVKEANPFVEKQTRFPDDD